ncbi:MAG: hypothetical protein QM779_05490 [Propionicimonas sp.]|uniref:hypothetical protein n=1 Tax=Propionicimonas sp. TaxID=1955623 RepID=UPI003D10027F
MSALLLEDLLVPVPTAVPQPVRWRHVERSPQARPVTALPGGRPLGVVAPPVQVPASATATVRPAAAPRRSDWQLTDRGIAVVVTFFLAVVAVATVVLVTAFLSVSDAPVAARPDVAVAAQG